MSYCKTCQSYAQHVENESDGASESECRRYPPVFIQGSNPRQATSYRYPIVCEFDGCGEHKPLQA